MKTTSKNQYAFANFFLIPVVSAVFGYNLYHVIAHQDTSNVAATLLLAVFTSVLVRKYGSRPVNKKQKN